MAQYNVGTARVLSADHNRWELMSGTTTGNIFAGNLVKFDGEAHLWYTVATIVTATSFDTVEDYNGAKAWDTFYPYLVTRDFTPTLQLPEASQGDRNTSDIYTRAVRRLDSLAGPNVIRLQNQTGGQIVAGDVVTVSTTVDQAVTTSDVAGSLKPFMVAMEPIAATGTGLFVVAGVILCKATGAIARGRYVRKSATLKAVEDGGAAIADGTTRPTTALGVSVSAASGGFCQVLFG